MSMIDFIWIFVFFITSFFYSASGLGGASAYLAYFSLMKLEHTHIPPTALFLSVLSTFTSTINWIKSGYIKKTSILFLIASVPAAFFGGKMKISQMTFNILLIITLFLVGFLMLKSESKEKENERNKNEDNGKNDPKSGVEKISNYQEKTSNYHYDDDKAKIKKIILALSLSSAIGFISGVIGIGGGIFLIPIVYWIGIMDYKSASATGAIFIFFNSIFGLLGHITKQSPDIILILKFSVPVVLGAFAGSFLGARKFSAEIIKKIFGFVVIFIASIKSIETIISGLTK
jgi:uncharacterized protein